MIAGARDTINIDESVHEIYKQLTEGTDPATAPFKTMKDVFLWAACLGYKKNDNKKISGKKITIFRWSQFNAQTDIPIIKAIVLSKTERIETLNDQECIINLLEEYANSGIYDFFEKNEGNVSTLWKIVEKQKLTGEFYA